MNVREIMVSNVPAAGIGTLVAELARLMLESGLGGVPVVENGRLVGMVTEADLVVKHARVHMPAYFSILGTVIPIERPGTDEEIRRVLGVTAGDLMERGIPGVVADASLEDVATLMVDEGINPVPVLDGDGGLLGMVSRRELVRLLLLEEESSEPSVTS